MSLTVTFWESPELDERSHKLNLVTLSTDMSQTNNQIVLQETLNYDASINSGQIKVNSESIYHF